MVSLIAAKLEFASATLSAIFRVAAASSLARLAVIRRNSPFSNSVVNSSTSSKSCARGLSNRSAGGNVSGNLTTVTAADTCGSVGGLSFVLILVMAGESSTARCQLWQAYSKPALLAAFRDALGKSRVIARGEEEWPVPILGITVAPLTP